MNARLLYRDKSLQPVRPDDRLCEDLELNCIIDNMGGPDPFVKETAAMMFADKNLCRTSEDIRYRQAILGDCREHPEEVRKLYALVVRCEKMDRDTHLSITHKKARFMLDVCVKVMISMQEPLSELYRDALDRRTRFCSEGFTNLFEGLILLFAPEKLAGMRQMMEAVSVKESVNADAVFGKRLRAESYHPAGKVEVPKKGVLRFLKRDKDTVEFDVDMGDQDASPALTNLKDEMAAPAASVVVRARDELFGFLRELRRELAFYIGCLNLADQMKQLSLPAVFPQYARDRENRSSRSAIFLSVRQLYNLSLSLQNKKASVPNDVDCEEEKMLVITGSNQGGKTTFLRSLGQAVMMMNSGMFVAAGSFVGPPGMVFTHFIREEDKTLKSGKLDEELVRMSEITGHIRPGDWLLLNESFASTNEEEGSEIAMEIITAMFDRGVRIACVTHFYQLVKLLKEQRREQVLYLNAMRDDSGTRTYRLTSGEPLVRGFGEDLYHEIFYDLE